MNIQLIPIPPDTVASLKEDALRVAEEIGVDAHFEGTAFGGSVRLNLASDDTTKAFIKAMKRICQVVIVP